MKNIFSMLAIAILFASCSKDKHAYPSAPEEKKLVETRSLTVAGEWIKYHYDATGRLTKEERANRFTTYAYEPSKITISDFFQSNGQLSSRQDLLLDASGRCTTRYYILPDGDTLFVDSFTYDAAGFVKKYESLYKTGEHWVSRFTTEAGNTVEDVTYKNGILNDSTRYYFNPNVVTKSGFNTVTDSPVGNLYGSKSKNTMAEHKRYNIAGQLVNHHEHIIELDADGYMTRHTNKNVQTGVANIKEYKYE